MLVEPISAVQSKPFLSHFRNCDKRVSAVWPEADEARQAAVAQAVLDARTRYAESTLADMYDPLTMPPELSKAHAKLDALVDKLYGRAFATGADRVAHLFVLYADRVKSVWVCGCGRMGVWECVSIFVANYVVSFVEKIG